MVDCGRTINARNSLVDYCQCPLLKHSGWVNGLQVLLTLTFVYQVIIDCTYSSSRISQTNQSQHCWIKCKYNMLTIVNNSIVNNSILIVPCQEYWNLSNIFSCIAHFWEWRACMFIVRLCQHKAILWILLTEAAKRNGYFTEILRSGWP